MLSKDFMMQSIERAKEKGYDLSPAQSKYLAEYERLKHITITPGRFCNVNKPSIEYEVFNIVNDTADIKTLSSGEIKNKTLHWIRKNLVKIT
jgi:hypothetical protein